MKATIFTDGAARGNPDGPGGYGALIRYTDADGNTQEKELSGGYPKTTNNRMELMGVIAALEEIGSFGEPCEGMIYSDSRYVVDAFEKHWITNWKKNGWKTASGAPVKNQDLWNRLLAALAPHSFRFQWVKGHADHPENERCDRLATEAADRVAGGTFPPEPDKSDPPENTTQRTAVLPDRRTGKETMTVRIRYLSDRIDKLVPPTNSANWTDLRSAEDIKLRKGEFRLIRLGVAMKLPEGYEAHVVPRSSTYKNFGIIQANHYGVIDNSYCGDEDEWMMPVIALRDTEIHINDRICQFRIERRQPDFLFEETDHLDGISRGGFGSTGLQ